MKSPDLNTLLAALPAGIAGACAPVFEELPLAAAMPALLPAGPAPNGVVDAVARAVQDPAISARPALQAGLWLYVDELDRSHEISQGLADATGSYWHGVMHRREGDFSNAHYWFHRAGRHPVLDTLPGFDPHAFVNAVAAQAGTDSAELLDMQRAEWAALFAWCATR